MGVHMCILYGQLAYLGRHYEFWKVYKGFRATCSPSDDIYFREGLVYFSRKMQNQILQLLLHEAWLRSRRVRALNWSACSKDLSPIENIWRIIKNKSNTTTKLFRSWKPISGKNGTKFQHRNSKTWCPDVFKVFWKEEEMLHHGKHAPVQTIFETCSMHQISFYSI